MRQVPLESDINIAVNGYSGFATSSQKGSFMTMLISRSRGTCLIYLSCQFHYNLMTTCHLDPEWFRAWRDRVIAGHHMNTPHTTLSSTNAGLCTPFIIRLKVEVLCVLFLTLPVCIGPNQNTRNLYLQADDKRCTTSARPRPQFLLSSAHHRGF